ncbi:SAC3/GANP/Nin1/mts3/eIF-3 p25 family-domain-containing protein [Lipomyces tetrasporus]|uniref:Nuclear mRNA export factor n=1 Tax=Lipomyces tetrasporus TaxID=54092 RepID=A0AAD7VRQ9_9ASCO|nr:SAC3/GANP/Nin1/mts3/eIF-3 p25 family-domain-containing protein [Lipomyces tetrasporus]KAJ8100297.1 SAC3/GANP/Nin1/mts3/eIF-3 p25 family-domain-containing protein [Lipomyces tetrasporus]
MGPKSQFRSPRVAAPYKPPHMRDGPSTSRGTTPGLDSASPSSFSNVNYFQNAQQNGARNNVASGFRKRGGKPRVINHANKVNGTQVQSVNPDDGWDARNQAEMNKLEETWTGDLQDLYEKLVQIRNKERVEMERRGLVDKQDTRKTLNEAIVFTGTCVDMCPVFERVRRARENNISPAEKNANGKYDRNLAVKAFSRPAAGQPPPLPSDVRPPGILQATLTYLIDNIVPGLAESHIHGFLWDRTRSIRQDFTYQNYSGYEAVDCNERIARIHIVCLHIMAGSDVEYSRQQELEQFNKALQTLSELYSDARKHGAQCPNEAEFQAYRLLSHLRDPDIDRQIQDLPRNVFLDPMVQLALELRSLAQQNNITERGYTNTENAQNMFVRFFKLVKSAAVPFLLACLAEVSFNDIRMWALKSMASGYHKRGKPYIASQIVQLLGCDDENELFELCDHWEVARKVVDGVQCVDVTSWNDLRALEKGPLRQAYSKRLVEVKRGNMRLEDFIHGNNLSIYPQNSSDKSISVHSLFPSSSSRVSRKLPVPMAENSKPVKWSFGLPVATSEPQQAGLSFLKTSASRAPPPFSFGSPSATTAFESAPAFAFGAKAGETPSTSRAPAFAFSASAASNQSGVTISSLKGATDSTTPAFSKESANAIPTPTQNLTASTGIDEQKIAADRAEKVRKSKEMVKAMVQDAATTEVDSIVRVVIADLVRKICQQALDDKAKRDLEHRKMLVSEIADELYASLVYDNTWETCQVGKANVFRRGTLLRKAIKHIKETAIVSKKNAELMKKRREQYIAASQLMGRPLKKQKFSSRRSEEFLPEAERIALMKNDREAVQQLWMPVDLKRIFLPSVETTFENSGILDGVLDVNVFTSDWHASAGIWLRRKLGLEWDGTKFCRTVEGKSLVLTVSTMEADPDSYETVGGLIFQCGMTGNDASMSVDQKLQFDSEALYEALRRLRKYSSYSISLLILYWPFDGVSTKDVCLLVCVV